MDDAKIEANLKLVEAHFDSEAGQHIERCLDTYTDDIVWEAPARHVSYQGKQAVADYYLRLWDSMDDVEFEQNDRYATEDRVFDDLTARFTITGDGFINCPFPVGTRVQLRLLHNFVIRDGLIAREIGYELWSEIKDGEVMAARAAPLAQSTRA